MLQIHWHSKTWFKLRFSGFTDEWNEDYLNKLFDNRNERNFESLEVLSVTINDGVLKRSDLGSDRKNKDKKSMKHVLKGDLVYNPMFMWKGASGISSYEGITSADYIVLKSKNNVNPIFFSHLFQTEKSLNKFKNYSQGSLLERLRLMYPQFSDIKMAFPSYEEQEKIANLLTFVDNKIELIEKKYQTYLDFKKYLMQQIFTQKLRFTDYIEEWKTIKLKDVGEINTGNTPSTKVNEYYSPKKYLWVTPSDISSKYIFDTAKRLSDEGAKKGRFVKKNSVLVTCIASIGKNCIILEDGYFNQQINSITPSQSFDLDFIYYLIDYNSEKMKNYAGITATPILNKKSFENMKFEFPSFDEQKQISNMLSNIDNKIFAIEELINKTQKFKKGLLQQMFVVRINWRCNFKLAKSPSFNKHLLILKNKIIFIIIK